MSAKIIALLGALTINIYAGIASSFEIPKLYDVAEVNKELSDLRSAWSYFGAGTLDYQNANCYRAIKQFEKALNYSRENFRIYAWKGMCETRIGYYQDAMVSLTEAMRLAPIYDRIHGWLAQVFYQNSDYKNYAAQELKEREMSKYSRSFAVYELGLNQYFSLDFEAALTNFKAASAIDRDVLIYRKWQIKAEEMLDKVAFIKAESLKN